MKDMLSFGWIDVWEILSMNIVCIFPGPLILYLSKVILRCYAVLCNSTLEGHRRRKLPSSFHGVVFFYNLSLIKLGSSTFILKFPDFNFYAML